MSTLKDDRNDLLYNYLNQWGWGNLRQQLERVRKYRAIRNLGTLRRVVVKLAYFFLVTVFV